MPGVVGEGQENVVSQVGQWQQGQGISGVHGASIAVNPLWGQKL
jgi:hypothetical protein